jgi:hypothetical protein
LVLVENRKGDLRRTSCAGLRRQDVVAADADELFLFPASERRHERHPALEVELEEASELIVGEQLLRSEETEVDRLCAEMLEVSV